MEAFARGFVRGALGLGAAHPKQSRSQFPTGVDRVFGRYDDLLEIWSLARAREAAWINGQLRWQLRVIPFLADDHLQSLDRITELAGRGLLRPLPL